MKFTKRRKNAVLASLVLMLSIAVFANWYYASPHSEIESAGSESKEDTSDAPVQNLGDAIYVGASDADSEYFADAKLSRDEAYASSVATLKEIISSDASDEDSVQTASDAITVMAQRNVAQANIENLVKAKTGSDCVAVISEDSAEIIISKSAITDSSVLQIKEIVMNNTGVAAEKISIIGTK